MSESTELFDTAEDPAEAVTQPLPVLHPDPLGAGRHRSPRRARRSRAAKAASTAARAAAAGGAAAPAGKAAASAKGGKKVASAGRRTGLLGASAAVAMGAVAVVSGLLPTGIFSVGGGAAPPLGRGASGQVLADGPLAAAPAPRSRPTAAADRAAQREQQREQGKAAEEAARRAAQERQERQERQDAGQQQIAAELVDRGGTPVSRSAERVRPASASASAPPAAPAAHSRPAPEATTPDPGPHSPPPAADDDGPAVSVGTLADTRSAAAHLVLALVNAERAKAGCRPLRADSRLNRLAQSFSDDMAKRGFFDHTDPDGRTPWDRAAKRGITNLGGENIARGHPDAHTVMDAWMRSSGHRANILNCDYRSLGVGVHEGGNGPWWTQDFGY
ncbi:hypothetical protein GCM10020000_22910 [Streptomyces olivoverticillatus]